MRREKSCGGVVYTREGGQLRFLLIRHKKGGHWAFPKGHMEAGESERQTARREILEETGVQVKMQGKFRESVAYDIGTIIHKTVVYFLCEIVGEPEVTIQEEEISDYAFFGPDEVPGHLTYSNDKHTFAKALRYIKSRNLA
ncbi:NUDIX domain-containing protein [Acetanaerobacterium sp. MSJ-12]|nr:NUDIX domain-containing protein [Acetanaerobacterium sp. MSJ-12]MBU5420629.1 NUDIX domain-containing protein [Acetanaerobacterium sp. MSJ-12]